MERNVILSAIVLLSVILANTAHAEPKNGFSIDFGLSRHSVTGNTTFLVVTPISYTSMGPSLGMDYQIAINPSFSINPFLHTSVEVAKSNAQVPTPSPIYSTIGLQFRYWAGSMFFGGLIGRYSEVQIFQFSGTGAGFGLVGGWENPQGGMYLLGQLDSANVSNADSNVKLKGFKLSMGYRWK